MGVSEWQILKLLEEATNPDVSTQNVPGDTEENRGYSQSRQFMLTDKQRHFVKPESPGSVKRAGNVNLTNELHLLPIFEMYGSIPPLPHMP